MNVSLCVSVQKFDYCLCATKTLSTHGALYEIEAVSCGLVRVNVCVGAVWGIKIRETAEVHTNPGLFPWARPRTDRHLFPCYFPADPNSDRGSLPRSVTVCWPPSGCSSWVKRTHIRTQEHSGAICIYSCTGTQSSREIKVE